MTKPPKAQAGAYPDDVTQDEGGFFPLQVADVPEAHTDGKTREEAEGGALDCLLAALGAYLELRRDILRASDRPRSAGRDVLPQLVAVTPALSQAMSEQDVPQVAPALRIGRDRKGRRRMPVSSQRNQT